MQNATVLPGSLNIAGAGNNIELADHRIHQAPGELRDTEQLIPDGSGSSILTNDYFSVLQAPNNWKFFPDNL